MMTLQDLRSLTMKSALRWLRSACASTVMVIALWTMLSGSGRRTCRPGGSGCGYRRSGGSDSVAGQAWITAVFAWRWICWESIDGIAASCSGWSRRWSARLWVSGLNVEPMSAPSQPRQKYKVFQQPEACGVVFPGHKSKKAPGAVQKRQSNQQSQCISHAATSFSVGTGV